MTVAIIISNETHELIKQQAITEWRETGKKLADGRWRIPVDDQVFKQLNRQRYDSGLTFDDVIQRMIRGEQ